MRNPYVIALLNPVNLAMLALATAAGLCSAWWMFPVGLLLWGVMVLVVANNPMLRTSQKMDARVTLTPRFQSKFEKIERVQVSMLQTINSAPAAIRKALEPVRTKMDPLVDEIYSLCQRSSGLENYRLVNFGKVDLEAEWTKKNQEIEQAGNPAVKQELQEALNSLEKRIGEQRKVVAQLDRLDAQLSSAENTLENVLSEVLRLQSMGAEVIKRNREGLLQSLHQLENEIHTVE